MTADCDGVGLHVDAAQAHSAGVGLDEAHEHFDGSGFAGGVWAEHGDEFAFFNGEAQVIHGGEVAELFYQIFQFDHGLRRRATP